MILLILKATFSISLTEKKNLSKFLELKVKDGVL